MERKLAAVLSADVAGYSRLMCEDENATHIALKAHLAELVEPTVAAHGGRVVKTTGDGLLAEFPSVVEAVACAADVQVGMIARNAGVADARRMMFRIGVHLGDVIVEPSEIYGEGVNLAVRLQELAEAGGICISGDAFRQVKGKTGLVFADLGERKLKNFTDPIRAYRVVSNSVAGASVPLWRRHGGWAIAVAMLAVVTGALWQINVREPTPAPVPPRAERPSIAVLPLVNLSNDPTQEYFSDGLTDDLITDLCKFSNLSVIASHSSFAYKGRSMNVQEIARELGVHYVLEGTVQRSNNRLRVNTQLIDAATGHHLWAERYDRDVKNVFDLQDEILKAVITKLAFEVNAAELAKATHKETRNMTAYDLWLQGRAIFSDPKKATMSGRDEARAKFEAALDLDPNYARAKAGLSYTHTMDWDNEWTDDPDASLHAALGFATQAVQLDDKDYYTHWMLAIAYVNKGDFDLGLAEYDKALAIDNTDPNMLAEMGITLTVVGRHDDAIARIKDAIARTPAATPYWYKWALGRAYYMKKQYQDAIAAVESIKEPANYVRLVWAASYAQLADEKSTPPEQVDPYKKKAKDLIDEFVAAATQQGESVWTVEDAQGTVFKDPADLDHWVDGLRKAGLPEN